VLDPNSGADDSAAPMPTRRRVLTGGGRGLLALALVGTAAAACGPSGTPGPDPLEAQLEAARRDSDLASAAATAVAPWLVPPLNVIADERARHAAALVEELARAAGKPTPSSTTPAAPASAAPGVTPAPPPTVQDVAIALRKSAESAAELVPALSGYRAGLLGSIAAACTASYTLGLTPPRSPARRPR
jgi:hypothetical protein